MSDTLSPLPPLDARVPAWAAGDLSGRDCPACGAGAAAPVCIRPDGLGVRRCGRCRALFVSPAPSPSALAGFYATYEEGHRRAEATTPAELARAYAAIEPLADLRIRELSSLMPLSGARVLDVGFGRPHFLCALRKLGAVPYGVELDGRAIEFARAVGIEHVFHGEIADLALDGSFDLVALNDLLEHPLDPLSVLKKAATLLRPGGLLLVWTPNGDSGGRDSAPVVFRVDLEHMQYFTTDSMLYLAAALGLRVVHLETLGFPNVAPLTGAAARPGARVRRAVRRLPGVAMLGRLRRRLAAPGRAADERAGAYHLFCILMKSA